jgi:hypothetical protein
LIFSRVRRTRTIKISPNTSQKNFTTTGIATGVHITTGVACVMKELTQRNWNTNCSKDKLKGYLLDWFQGERSLLVTHTVTKIDIATTT